MDRGMQENVDDRRKTGVSHSIRQQLRKTSVPLLLAFAILGWTVAIWAVADRESVRRSYSARLQSLESDYAAASARLANLQAEAGSAEYVAQRIVTSQSDLERVRRQQADLSQQIPALRK